MWQVHYIADNSSQAWTMLDVYDSKAKAIINACTMLSEYFMIKVTDPEGSVIWSN